MLPPLPPLTAVVSLDYWIIWSPSLVVSLDNVLPSFFKPVVDLVAEARLRHRLRIYARVYAYGLCFVYRTPRPRLSHHFTPAALIVRVLCHCLLKPFRRSHLGEDPLDIPTSYLMDL